MVIQSPLADKHILDLGKRLVDVITPFITHTQPPCPLLPTEDLVEGTLCYPPKAAQLLPALPPRRAMGGAIPRFLKPRRSLLSSASCHQLLVIVSLIRMNLLRTVARTAPLASHKRDRIHCCQQLLPIRNIGSRKHYGQRQPVSVYRLMALRACPPSVQNFIHRRRANRRAGWPPFLPLWQEQRCCQRCCLHSCGSSQSSDNEMCGF